MALEGTLESFGIAEIFQLISTQSKTGILHLEIIEGNALARFYEGRLVDAKPPQREEGEFIGSMLLRSGLVSPTQLNFALTEQEKSLRRLGDILVGMGALNLNEFREMLHLQNRETVFQLLRLTRGRYKFSTEPIEVDRSTNQFLEVDSLLMEGSRQIDEWPHVLKRIPSENKVYVRVEGVEPNRELTEAESSVLELVDGASSVRNVVDRARLGNFTGWDSLASLYDEGLIAPRRTIRKVAAAPEVKKPSWFMDFVLSLLILAMGGLIFVQLGGFEPTQLKKVEYAMQERANELENKVHREKFLGGTSIKDWPPVD